MAGAAGWHPSLHPCDVESYGGNSATYQMNRSNQTWGHDWSAHSPHDGTVMVSMADGSVRGLSTNMSGVVYEDIRVRDDGEGFAE